MAPRLRTTGSFASTLLFAVLLLAAGCGGSSSVNVVEPSTSRCEIAVTNSMQRAPAAGATGSLTVSTNRECSWSARAEAPWISLGSSEGQGPVTMSYSVAANANGTPRQGAVVVGEARVAVVQDAAPCRFEVSPTSHDIGAAGGAISVSLTAPGGCPWSARSEDSWISGASPASGDGRATVRFNIGPNPGPVRSGTVVVGGVAVRVNQTAGSQPSPSPAPSPPVPPPTPSPDPTPVPPDCSYTVTPTRKTVAASGEAMTVTVTAASGCAWSSSSGAGWISITAGQSGSADGSVKIVVDRNSGAARTGTVTVAGKSVTIEQLASASPPACRYSIAPTARSIDADPTELTVSVRAADGCTWTAASQTPWITVADGRTGSGNGTVRLTVGANGGQPRTGSVTIGGETFSVQQKGAACSYAIKPTSYQAGRSAENVVVNVTAGSGCTWAATSDVDWVTVAEGRNGSGNGTVNLRVQANGDGASRTGTVTIAGEAFTVHQEGPTCSYSIAPKHYDAGRGPDDVRVTVTAGGDCAWTAASNASWVSIAEGRSGTGSGTVRLIVEANSGAARTATLTIAGQAFALSQAAGCTATIKPTNYDAGRGPDDIRITVTTDAVCSWTATSTESWVTVAEGRSGSGNGTVRLLVEPNGGDPRRATLTIAGERFTLRQEGRRK